MNAKKDILRVEGIMAQGYGVNPKVVMRDRKLTPEAKCIYSYLASFAGNGTRAFPGREVMLADLQMGKNRYYKHLKLLIAADYIHVEREKNGNLYGRNIYTIIYHPEWQENEEGVTEQKPAARISGKKEDSGIEVSKTDKTSRGLKKVVRRASISQLRERLAIDELKKADKEHAELIEEVFMAIEDMESAEQVKISGTFRKREELTETLDALTPAHISLVAERLSESKKEIFNRKSYIQTCVSNSIFDINSKKTVSPAERKRQEDAKKQSEEELRKQKTEQAYQAHPELREIDQKLIELAKKMSKAILSGNESLHNQLKSLYTAWDEKRISITKKYGLECC